MKSISTLLVILLSILPYTLPAQTVFSGTKIIDKKEYPGLVLSTAIPDKHLSSYWESYLDKYGKVKGKRGIYTIEKASVPTVSPNPVQVTSEISSEKKLSQIFMALYADGSYAANTNDQTYKAAERMLKEFSEYAAKREDIRLADEAFSLAEKNYQKLQEDINDRTKEIERTEKKLTELRSEVEKGKTESERSLLDLQNKQKALEKVKSKLSVK